MPPGLPEALSRFGIDAATLEKESQVYQYLLVARQVQAEGGRSPLTAVPAIPYERRQKPVASLIVLTCNQLEYTRQCLESIFEHTSTPFELIVVDNGSTDGTLDYLGELVHARPEVRIIANPVNLGYGAGNNQGMALAEGDYIGILNNDLIVTAGWLERMIAQANYSDRVGAVGPRSNVVSGPQEMKNLIYADVEQMHVEAAHLARYRAGSGYTYPRIVGFCMLLNRAVIDAIGGFDERFGLANFEDDDLCWRINTAGFECRIAEDVFVHHHGSRTLVGESIDHKACMQSAWGWFVQKWNLDPEMTVGSDYPITQRRFQPAMHFSALPAREILPVRGRVEHVPCPAEMADRYNATGERLYEKESTDWALAFFEAALSWDDGCAEALNNLGVIAFHENRMAEASGTLRHALARAPHNKNTLWNLISIYLQSGMKDQARELLEESVHVDGNNAKAVELLKSL